jgi:hypothetical protein
MKSSGISAGIWIAAALFTTLAPNVARADGGIVRLREAQGPFLVTVFVSPEPVEGAVTDVSVLVQHRLNGDVVLDAEVNLTVDPPPEMSISESDPLCGLSPTAVASRLGEPTLHSAELRATREQASNKLLYAAPLKLHAGGDWRLHVTVSQGTDTARFDCLLPVTRPSIGLARLWPYLIFPPIVIIAFAMNQWLRRQSLERTLNPNLAS